MTITNLLPSIPTTPLLLLAASFCAALLVYVLVSRMEWMLAPAPTKALARYFGRAREDCGVARVGGWPLRPSPGLVRYPRLERH